MRARLLALAGVLVLAACARAEATASSYHPLDEQQQGTCDGVPVPASLHLLRADAIVVAAVICATAFDYVPGQGMWQVQTVRAAPATGLAQLRSALLQPDLAPPGVCAAVGYLAADFVLTLADGSRIRPGLPGDGCNARVTSLPDSSGWPVTQTTRVKQVMGDAQTKAGCGPFASSPAVWLEASREIKTTGSMTMPSSAVGVCLYHGFGKNNSLTKVGLVSLGGFQAAWPTVSAAAPSGCRAATIDGPVGDWLVLSPAPAPPYTQGGNNGEFALVELDGCRRLVSPDHGLVGYVSPAQADRLAALADQSP